ncbi:LacI family DNA-binding transcriptional regulator [Phycicoccus duodecadis]|uniref:LacI family transcriptional regulator n=1 Tax=Phycicoccus duodecadis TaxID=173053 RepID=A0A2N3YM14_9MICO|nr:LacI family DNA-binding transcriptional regulator [Phycicoccus duodecadis]PKW27893.1 LacI family transcriptional regulator [Phycicoccus duodecadis]
MPPAATAPAPRGPTPKTPRPTIRDIAARAGVSKSLVSLALGGAPRVAPGTRQAILDAAEELGYRRNAAAQALGAHRTRTIGVFVLDLHNPITADLLQAVQAEARRRDYRTIVVVGDEDAAAERAELEKLLEFRVEGIIALGHRLPDGAREAFTADCPAVVIGSQQEGVPHLVSMSNDDVAGASLAVDHLVALGHERIAHIDGGSSAVARDRRRGYRAAMRRHGLAEHITVVKGSFTDEGGYRGASQVLAGSDPPTALFVVNDLAALGVLAAVADRGLAVPGDVSVIGYDGTRMAGLRALGLTTVAQPLDELGTRAAALLCGRLEGEPPGSPVTRLTPTLVVRRTTAPPASRHPGGPGPGRGRGVTTSGGTARLKA